MNPIKVCIVELENIEHVKHERRNNCTIYWLYFSLTFPVFGWDWKGRRFLPTYHLIQKILEKTEVIIHISGPIFFYSFKLKGCKER